MSNKRSSRTCALVLPAIVGAALVAFAVASCGRGGSPISRKQPNIVVIIADTLRADKLGCYGFEQDTSPELDRLAASGVRFARCVAQCSWTRPSIGSMLTGRYPRSLGLYEEENEILNDSFVTLAEALKSSGYKTLGITANPVINTVWNMHQGCDRYVDSSVIFSWMQPEEGKVTARHHALNPAKDIFDTVINMVERNSEAPGYVQVNIMETHEYWRKHHHLTRDEFQNLFKGMRTPRYLQAVRQVSVDVEAFIRDLTAVPGWEDTLFIFTSDHGQGLDDHPHVPHSGAHGRILYESQLMVPLIFYRTGSIGPTGVVVEQPVRLMDMAPTVLDYVGVPVPEEMDGSSLFPLFREGEAEVALPENFVAETSFRQFEKIAVYGDDWKYIENRDGHPRLNPRELQPIGIKEDGPRTDKIDDHPDVAARLQAYLADWEKRYPEAQPTRRTQDMSETEREQLKAIGYLQ